MTVVTPSGESAASGFAALAAGALNDLLDRRPVFATSLGDHRADDRLDEATEAARQDELRVISEWAVRLDSLPRDGLAAGERVDAEILRTRFEERRFLLEELCEHAWDPLAWNPGTALHLLLARPFGPTAQRLRALAGRLTAVPETLAIARATLGKMPRVHVETALGQVAGVRTLLANELERALDDGPGLRREVQPARERALAALEEHLRWLAAARDDPQASGRNPRLGPEMFSRKLALVLDADTDPAVLLCRAEDHLAVVEDKISEVVGRLSPHGRPDVRAVLNRIAAEAPVRDATVVELCREALQRTTAWVRSRDLVTYHDDPLEIVVMPEIHRGVAVAYCDPPGPLEPVPLPTRFAVAPTPQGWPEERVASFYREYNVHMLHDLTVHETIPGHALQLSHAYRHAGTTPLRAAFRSGSFVEGWAVLSEELMADAGYGAGDTRADADAFRLQQLKMQLRMTLNAILDVRVHCHLMTQAEAMRLLTGRGHQELGEAVGKWRRALLTSTQLSTYFVGYSEMRAVADALRAARPEATHRARHDALLAHGCPAPRHLWALLGL